VRKARSALFLAAAAVAASPAFAQLRIVTSNASNAADLMDQSTARTPWITTILSSIGSTVSDDPTLAGNTGIAKPIDILCLQESTSPSVTAESYRTLLNSIYSTTHYQRGGLSGGSTGGGTQTVVYNDLAVTLISETTVGVSSTSGQPRQTLRYQFRPVGYDSSADIYIYDGHYKAGDDSTSEGRRLTETTAIRTNADALGSGKNIIYLGDMNVYRNTDTAYVHLLAAGNGQAIDPINKQGNWNNDSSFKNVHTQSPYNSTTASSLGTGSVS
jgi:hypothetical protein